MVDKVNLMKNIFTQEGKVSQGETKELEIKSLNTFHTGEYEHIFSVEEDADMLSLIDDIKDNGVLEPILVRPDGEDEYEIIAGHRRVYASKKLGLDRIKAVILDYDDDTAIKVMILTNLKKRSEIKPSEKAFAYKTYMQANKRQGIRTDLKKDMGGASKELSESTKESKQTIYRMINLTKLIPPFLCMVDKKDIHLSSGFNLSHISTDVQNKIYEVMKMRNYTISYENSAEFKKRYISNELHNLASIEQVFKADSKKDDRKITNNKVTIKEIEEILPSHIKEKTTEEIWEYLKIVLEFQKKFEEDEQAG